MTYSPLNPPIESSPKTSVSGIQTNFASYASVFSATVGGVVYNHYALNTNFQGKHGAVIFDQIADPSVVQTLVSLYAKNTISAATPSGQPQLYARVNTFLPNGVPNTPMQLTYNSVNTAGPQYQSFMIGGYLVFMGSIQPMTLAPPFVITLVPTTSAILNVQAASQNPNGVFPFGVTISNITANTFQINAPLYVNTNTYIWMAIAKA